MTHDPQSVPSHDAPHGHDSVELPRPTVAPLVLSLGLVMLAAGLALGMVFMIVGGVILVFGLGMWISEMLPGRGHCHEPLVDPSLRPKLVTGELGGVQRMKEGLPGSRMRMPEEVHPISAGIKGGIVAGLLAPIPAMIYCLIAKHSIWYPANLLAGMVLTDVGTGDDLEQFRFSYLILASVIHVVMSLVLGLIYGVLLPMLPEIPQAMAWGALLAPLVWTTATYIMMRIVNPGLREGVSWPWFLLSQFIYGVVMALVVTQATELRPVVRGLAGGALGGLLMPLPALLWALSTTDRGIWYPLNLLAGMMVPGLKDPEDPRLRVFHADWLVMGIMMHAALSLGFAVACALLMPKLRPIRAPLAWGGLLMPLLWTGASFSLMGVVNPVLQGEVHWPSFIASQFVFGIVASIVVVRSELVYITPAGQGPDRVPITAKSGVMTRREAEQRRAGEANR